MHNRPAIEKLTQVKNRGQVVIYMDKSSEIITLEEGESYTIKPANTWHIHVNPFDKVSLVYWDFEGNIKSIIENIRKNDYS